MKKLLAPFFFMVMIVAHTASSYEINVSIDNPMPHLAWSALGTASYAVALWLLGDTLVDAGHRYLTSKQVAYDYADDLSRDGKEVLNDKEVEFWSFIQGLSSIPMVWWREISSLAVVIAFIKVGNYAYNNARA